MVYSGNRGIPGCKHLGIRCPSVGGVAVHGAHIHPGCVVLGYRASTLLGAEEAQRVLKSLAWGQGSG